MIPLNKIDKCYEHIKSNRTVLTAGTDSFSLINLREFVT